jgi:hypothetical protein
MCSKAAGIALGLMIVAAIGPPAAAGQSPEPLPEWLEPELPPGVDRLCDSPVGPDPPLVGELRAIANASEELPALPAWCDGTCVIDIAFFYDPEAIGQTRADRFGAADPFPDKPYGPQTVGDLRSLVLADMNDANVTFRKSDLDAELRLVGMERYPALSGLVLHQALPLLGRKRDYARQEYGADLLYAITGTMDPSACGIAYGRGAGTDAATAAQHNYAGAMAVGCMDFAGSILSHEVGHNLGLAHEDPADIPFVPFGHGFAGETELGLRYGTIMAGSRETPFFSTPEPVYGRILGSQEVSDAARALRYTIPDAARYSPTVVPYRDENPHGYDCRLSETAACMNERRFRVRAAYSTQSVSRAPAKQLDTYGLADTGALFYFFGPDNPEMLVKVVNGCWLNDHWWVFGSAATDLVYEVAIEDLAAGGARLEYQHHGKGVIAGTNGYSTGTGVISDTMAFPCERAAAPASGPQDLGVVDGAAARELATADWPEVFADLDNERATPAGIATAERANQESLRDDKDYGCVSLFGVNLDCLAANWRFGILVSSPCALTPCPVQSVTFSWGITLPTYGLGGSGALFFFFTPDNPEMLLKVLNGCAVNGHWWVFGSAATDLQYVVRIVDYATASPDSEGEGDFPWSRVQFGRWHQYEHHGGGRITGPSGYSTLAGVIADTMAFPCDP